MCALTAQTAQTLQIPVNIHVGKCCCDFPQNICLVTWIITWNIANWHKTNAEKPLLCVPWWPVVFGCTATQPSCEIMQKKCNQHKQCSCNIRKKNVHIKIDCWKTVESTIISLLQPNFVVLYYVLILNPSHFTKQDFNDHI